MSQEAPHPLAARFERFANSCEEHQSPLYARCARLVAGDYDLLALAGHARSEPVPNVFFGAVHFLLLQGTDHPLRDHYPSVRRRAADEGQLGDALVDFCRCHIDEMIALMQSRRVQTNEVNRCAVLVPAFCEVYARGQRQPLAMIEIGASAGLNLFWDRYHIRYSDGTLLGPAGSDVSLACQQRGTRFAQTELPSIAYRKGIDLHPVDIRDPDQRLWLEALVWPDQPERAARLRATLALAQSASPQVLAGDALQIMPDQLNGAPAGTALCVYHSSVLYQFTEQQRTEFSRLLAEASVARPLWHVSAENEEGLWLFVYRQGKLEQELFLADFDGHGRWIDWKA